MEFPVVVKGCKPVGCRESEEFFMSRLYGSRHLIKGMGELAYLIHPYNIDTARQVSLTHRHTG